MSEIAMNYNGYSFADDITIVELNRNILPSRINKTKAVGNSNGAKYMGGSFDMAVIEVKIVIVTDDFTTIRRHLGRKLKADKPSRLIFSDEPDIYYNAIIDDVAELEEIYNVGHGTLTFLVPEGFGHSTTSKGFTATPNAEGILEMTIVNDGLADVPIDFKIKHNHENGYIGIVSEQGALQIGNVKEMDGENFQKSETVFGRTEALTDGTLGVAVLPAVAGVLGLPNKNGSLRVVKGIGNLSTENQIEVATGGSGSDWIGQSLTRTFKDSENKTTAKNWYTYFRNVMILGSPSQMGTTVVSVTATDDTCLAAWIFCKHTVGEMVHVSMVVNNVLKKQVLLSGHASPSFNHCIHWDSGHYALGKEGDKFTFYMGTNYSFVVPGTANKEIKSVNYYLGRRAGKPAITYQRLRPTTYLIKNNVEKWRDVPNRFVKGNEIIIKGSESKVYSDGLPILNDVVKGSEYPLAKTGNTKIQILCSDFSDPLPTVTAEITESY